MRPRALFGLWLCGWLWGCGSSPASPAADAVDAGDETDGGEPLPPRDTDACAGAAPFDARGFSREYAFESSGSPERDRAFYLTTVLADMPWSGTLADIGRERESRLRAAPAKCDANAACYAAEIRWSDEDVTVVAAALPDAARAVASLHLRPSGMFILRAGGSDDELVSGAWKDTAAAMNASYDAYAATLEGAALKAVVTDAAGAPDRAMSFFEPELRVVLAALTAQKRDEATRYDPLVTGENKAAAEALTTTDWAAFPYSAIVVPGLGPETLEVGLTEGGAARCDLAARRHAARYAPFILVSGGHVHPDRTPYSEAIEMKRYLVRRYGIGEDAILVDPYARHTTTNLRNAARLLLRYGVPPDRPILVTSDVFQSLYIDPQGLFAARCDAELGYRPWRVLAPISSNDRCMVPSALTLQADGRDPLDP